MEGNEILSAAKLHGLILAGGQSRRMGRDKAMIDYHGVPQYAYLAGLLEGLGVIPYLSARKNQIMDWNPEIQVIPDFFKNSGPLAGLLSAHLASPSTAWLVVACDFVYLEVSSIKQLIDSRDPHLDITTFQSPYDNKTEPFLSIWEPSSLTDLPDAIHNGNLSARSYMAKKQTSLIKPNWPEQLQNINSESDLRR